MQTLRLSLEEKSILTDANIRSMKQYIANKFPTYSSASRANILANSVHRHINDYLPPVDDLLKDQIRAQLLYAAFKDNSFHIGMLDISKACYALSSGKREILDPLEYWLKQQRKDATAEQIANFIQEMQEELGIQNNNQNNELADQLVDNKVSEQDKWYQRLTIQQILKSNTAVILFTLMLCANFSTQRLLFYEPTIISNPSLHQSLLLDEVISKFFVQHSYPHMITNLLPKNELTERYNYHSIPVELIRQWLKNRDSILAEEPYLSTIMATALQYNIHPFLMLAIAGQEQALVPNSNRMASKIANNPFNVYHSWKDYNTDIADSSQITAKTILTLAKGRPEGTHPLKWINRKYAEDTKWHIGVEAYFEQMLLQVTYDRIKADS